MSNGNLSERDRLLQYTVGEFYQDLSLFIEEGELREAQLKKMRQK